MSPEKPYYDNAYVTFPTGRLSLHEIQQIFSTIPFELDLIDNTGHFSWYSDKPNREHVRTVDELNETVEECHPARLAVGVNAILRSFKEGRRDRVERAITVKGERILIQYYALRDVDGSYLGTIEFTGNVEHIIRLFDPNDPVTDAVSGASRNTGDRRPSFWTVVKMMWQMMTSRHN